MKKALITGITGQDGAYLAKFLLSKGYIVYGTYRRSSTINFWRIKELQIYDNKNLYLVEFDLTDFGSIFNLIKKINPDEIYNLAAQSFVATSFNQPNSTAQITGVAVLNILEAIRYIKKDIRFYQASSSEMFGKAQIFPQNETTPFHPRSPYGIAKLFAHWTTINYQESYGIFAVSGILFNHESPLRGLDFVTRKITDGVAKIKLGINEYIELGNLDAKRDWGYAEDYVEGMWLMLQEEKPETYVLATNYAVSIRDFVTLSFKLAGISIKFEGKEEGEVGIDVSSGKIILRVSPKLYRPAEVDFLLGDPAKAKLQLGWNPKVSLEDLVKMMLDSDLKRNSK
ncbi:GDP-mannose 4,6-dehydratase [Candidatus Methylopumilus planktonicus]|uniref:GDP-mannose 4,6-dehydratase n=1 Tax=Candidatus Methylopumilus planktonicus TaxID=1581557 RepID=UPI003BEF0BB9